jgi:HEAT repeat protein
MDRQNRKNKDAVQRLFANLQSDDEKIRRYAAEDLGYWEIKGAIPYLAKGLEDPSVAVSEVCANSLVKIGGSAVAEQVAPAFASENVRLRNHASEIMNLLGEPAVPTLIEQLASPNHDVRMFAVDNLVYISSKKSVNALVNAMDDCNINVAAAAAVGVGKVGDPHHFQVLESHLESDTWVKCSVIRGMGFLGNRKAIEVILPLIQDEDLMVKISAIQALVKLANYEILPQLLNLLREESLDLFGTETLNVIHEIITSYPDKNYSDLFDKKLVDAMLQLTQIGDVDSRIKAVEILGYSRNQRVVPELIRLIACDGIDTRKSIIQSITMINPQDLDLLKQFLEDPEATFEQKCTALECIGRSTHKSNYAIIKEFLGAEDETLPRITLDAIRADFQPAPVIEIIKLLSSPVAEIRISAAGAMGRLEMPEFIPFLINKLIDDVPEVQEAVDDALIKIGSNHEIPILAPYLDSFGKMERKTAFEVFGLRKPESISDKVIEGLQDSNVEIRVISYKVIANLKMATLEMVKQGINDPVDTVQVQAVRTIKSLPETEKTLEFIKTLLSSSSSERLLVELIQVLAGLEGFNVVDSLLPLLEDKSPWVQLEVVDYLKKRGDYSIIGNLKNLLDSDDEELVITVENAIEMLEQSNVRS